MGYFSDTAKIRNISFGLVYVLFLSWLIFRTSMFVPEEQKNYWYMVFIAYAVLNTLVIGNADLRNKLFNVRLIDFIPRFLLFFGISLVFYYVVLSNFSFASNTFFGMLKNIPLYLAVIHAMVFATTESVVWQGYLDDKIGKLGSAFIFGVFHWGVWSGGALIVIPSAMVLGSIFSFVNWKFKKNNSDLVPAIATHTAYNFIKLGFMLG